MMDLARNVGARMMEFDVGGGFGTRGEFYPEDYLVPVAAHGCSAVSEVRTEDRRENLTSAQSCPRRRVQTLEIACTHDRHPILALRGEGYTDLGAYLRSVGATASRNLAQVMSGAYRIPHFRMEVTLLVTNKTPSGTYRGPGRF